MQFKDMLYSLSASVAAGRQMEEAIVEAEENLSVMYGEKEPIMKELKYMKINITENKESDKLLLKDFACRSKIEDIEDFVQVYITCRNMGGDLEKIIGHTTEILTDKMSIEREIRAITSQKKTEGRIISMMPLVMLLMLNIFSYSYIEPLYSTFAGRLIMSGALAAMVFGIYLMEKISDIEI
ncbi:MAG: type II secretion system F family protein [Anaerovoracaceae bacterium]